MKILNKRSLFFAASLVSSLVLIACYSFTGGSVPEHLKTIYIAPTADVSGYGNPVYGQELNNLLIENFRDDAALEVAETGGDAKLTVSIKSIREETAAVNPGELESERKITVAVDAEYYDAVKKKVLWNKSFTAYDIYDVSDPVAGKDAAILTSIEQLSDDILLAVVSGW